MVFMFARMAEDEMGCDRHQIPDQTIQRLAASHPHCQYRHSIHRGQLKSLNSLWHLKINYLNFHIITLLKCMYAVFLCLQYKASKEGTVMGVAVSKISMLTHCQALTQACNYCEGQKLVLIKITSAFICFSSKPFFKFLYRQLWYWY